MARQPELIDKVIALLGEGKSTKEIVEETGCSKSTVTVARKKLKAREGDLVEATKDIETDVDDNIDRFIKSIKITPPPQKPEEEEEDEAEDYQCPKCSHSWSAPKTEKQDSCPNCAMEFA